ncbi:hypothetical protein ACEQ8H_002021, partial [Pleosporales sp. CAS-2024a]
MAANNKFRATIEVRVSARAAGFWPLWDGEQFVHEYDAHAVKQHDETHEREEDSDDGEQREMNEVENAIQHPELSCPSDQSNDEDYSDQESQTSWPSGSKKDFSEHEDSHDEMESKEADGEEARQGSVSGESEEDETEDTAGKQAIKDGEYVCNSDPVSRQAPIPLATDDKADEEPLHEFEALADHQATNEADEHDQALLDRIYTALAYTQPRLSRGLVVTQTKHFTIPLPTTTFTPSPAQTAALDLLRASPAVTTICTAPAYVVFELGVPTPYLVPESIGIHTHHDPQWWAGKSAAEIRAGPLADKADLKKTVGIQKGIETRRAKLRGKKTKRQEEIDWKLDEG